MDEVPYWVSWFATAENGEWELRSPWWISGSRGSDGAPTVVAAVFADSDDDAKRIIEFAHDSLAHEIEYRFCEPRSADWSPFCDRFPRAKWMEWH
jgi:hypothetical protein